MPIIGVASHPVLEFRNFEDVSTYKKHLRKWHFEIQKGICCYCEDPMEPYESKSPMRATLEHLEPVCVTRKKAFWQVLKKRNNQKYLYTSFGDLSKANTRAACHRCNSTRPSDITWIEWKEICMKRVGKEDLNSVFVCEVM